MNIIKIQGDTEKRKGVYYEYDTDSVPLGEGGMGRVYKGFCVVERTNERTPIAVKAIYENIPARIVERARREASIQLENDNLIRMYSFVETLAYGEESVEPKIRYFVIMELLVGVTLEKLINGVTMDQNGMQIPFASEIYNQYLENRYATVVRIIKPILTGLMALHDKGYIHRDIDPSNIMVTIDGKIKLIDFGICKQVVSLGSIDRSLTTSGVFMGKVNYAAPELVLGDVKNQSYTTDIYALGILIYQLCAGHLPFMGTDQDILTANLQTKLPMKDIHVKEFRRIIGKATEKNQSKRYASVAELRVDLERVSLVDTKSNILVKVVLPVLTGVCVAAGVGYAIWEKTNDNKEEKQSVVVQKAPSCEELYQKATDFLVRSDDIKLQKKGKALLRTLVEDSLYAPAELQYYVLLINSNQSSEMKKGLMNLEKMAEKDSLNSVANFECGLTYSKDNRFFPVPADRQTKIGIIYDFERANFWLYRAMKADENDYKSIYWAFNNLMEMKVAEVESSRNIDSELVRLYKLFFERVEGKTDPIAKRYQKAIEYDGKTLRNWGLL